MARGLRPAPRAPCEVGSRSRTRQARRCSGSLRKGFGSKPRLPRSHLDILFLFCSHEGMIEYGELSFKVLRLEPGGQEVIARAGNYEICKAAFDKACSYIRRSKLNCAK